MVNINLDLVIQGQLDLRIAGSIGLLEDGRKRSEIQHSKRPPIQELPRFPPSLSHREQEAAEQIGWDEIDDAIDRLSRDEIEGGDKPGSLENRFQPRRPLSRAARKTRQAIAGLSESLKSGETQRIREATEHLRKAVLRLNEEVQRGADATALDEGY
jgi:hypothetical protein